jgi:hypothetical protein
VTPAGATHEKVPELVKACWPIAAGVTELLAALLGPVPKALVAATVIVYAVPVVKPVTVIGEEAPVAVSTAPVESLASAI